MAKTSSIEKNNKRKKLAKQYAAKRAALKAITKDQKLSAGGALRRAAQARRTAAQFVADARSQPLRSLGPCRAATTASSS